MQRRLFWQIFLRFYLSCPSCSLWLGGHQVVAPYSLVFFGPKRKELGRQLSVRVVSMHLCTIIVRFSFMSFSCPSCPYGQGCHQRVAFGPPHPLVPMVESAGGVGLGIVLCGAVWLFHPWIVALVGPYYQDNRWPFYLANQFLVGSTSTLLYLLHFIPIATSGMKVLTFDLC